MGYPGGKGRLWRNIVAMMPPHDVYIETHLGGGAVLRNKRPSRLSIGIDLDQSVINAAAEWEVPGLALHQGDAVRFLEDYAFTGCELVYVDPPYMAHLKNGRRYYRYEYSDEDHVKLLSTLCTLDCAVMISGYPSDTYEASLRGWRHVDLANVTHAGLKKERIWANFDFSDDLHDYDPVGPDFRERERVRRKTDRWTKRLSAMPEIERRAVLAALIQAPEVEPSFIGRLLRQRLEAAR